MILSAQSIENYIKHGLVIMPFVNEKAVYNGMSYGLSAAGYDIRIKQTVVVPAGQYVLASTIEYLEIPTDLLVKLADKSSWARRGVCVQNTIFEPGWRGYPTLEISNHGPAAVQVHAGSPIGQLIFHKLDHPTRIPYQGKYQDQPDKPVGAKYE